MDSLPVLLRLGRVRFLAFETTVFSVGYINSQEARPLYFILGVLTAILWQYAVALTNTWADHLEDEIDYPHRAALITRVGAARLRRVADVAALAVVALTCVMWVYFDLPWMVGSVWLIALVGGLAYSRALRLKTKTFGAPLAFLIAEPIFLFLGYAPGADGRELWPILVVLALGNLRAAGAKDLPNVQGDTSVGFRSIYWSIMKGPLATYRLMFVIALPFAAVALFVALGTVERSGLAILVLLPLGLLLGRAVRRADPDKHGWAIREVAIVYDLAFVFGALISYFGTAATAYVCAGGLIWYFIGSSFHIDPRQLNRRALNVVVRLAVSRGGSAS